MGWRRSQGLTLIELMVVVVVLFLISAAAIPVYQNYIHTGHQNAIMTTVEQFHLFEQNYHTDNGTYVAGSYVPHGTNSFQATLGYQVQAETSKISFTVTAGACGSIAKCYRISATDGSTTGVWDSSTNAWTWTN